MKQPRILIAGLGNIFLGDDAFGSETARRLVGRKLPECVRVIDFGVRSFDLAAALTNGYDLTILIDAVARGGQPGALYLIEPDLDELSEPGARFTTMDPHALSFQQALALVKSMGGECGRVLLVGCEPRSLRMEEGRMGLSEPVQAAVDEAVAMIELLITETLQGRQAAAP